MLLCKVLVLIMITNAYGQQDIKATRLAIAKAPADTNKLNLYKDALKYYKRINLDSAIIVADEGLKLAEALKSNTSVAYLLWQKGIMDREQGKLVIAKDNLERALEIYTVLGDQKKMVAIINELGVVEGTKANFQEATRYFLKALAISEHMHDTMGMGQAYIKLGVVNQSLNNLDKATEYFKYAFELCRKTGDTLNMAHLYSNMGIVEGIKENDKLAFRYFDTGLSLCTTEKFIYIKLGLLLNMGIAQARAGNDARALEIFNEGLLIARERSMLYDVPNLLLNIALLDHVVSPKEKLPLLKEALRKAKEGGQRPLVVNIYSTLADVCFDQGNYKDAYLYLDTSTREEREVFSMKKNTEIANLQALYELNRSQGEVAQLTRQNYERNLQRNAIIAVAVIALLALVVVFSSYRKTNRLNEALRSQREELANANVIKDKIFSIIGHDLRAPTATIIGMLRVLEESDGDMTSTDRMEVYKTLGKHSQATLETLNHLLLWGSREIKGVSIQKESFMANEHVAINMRLIQEQAIEKQLQIINEVPPAICIEADPSHFDFVVRNLLFNAVKYSFKGGQVKIGVRDSSNDRVCFYVSDTGVGIPDALKEQLFTLNSASRPGTNNEKGTGLGLVLCRDFVEMNGGRIWVDDAAGQGTVFCFEMKKGNC